MMVLPSLLKEFDSHGLGPGHAPGDQTSGFQIAESSGQHMLGYISDMTAQFPMSIRPLLQRKQNQRGPSADKDRSLHPRPGIVFLFIIRGPFRCRYNLVLAAHKTNLTPDVEMMGVTSVAGFQWIQ
jgi:hypothetical protein